MPRRDCDFEILIRIRNKNTGRMHVIDKLELSEKPFPSQRYFVRFNERNSNKFEDITITEICKRMRKLICLRIK